MLKIRKTRKYPAIDNSPEEIWKRLSRAVTNTKRVRKRDSGDPTQCNIYKIAAVMDEAGYRLELPLDEVAVHCRKASHGCVVCKKNLSKTIAEFVIPIGERKSKLLADEKLLIEVIRAGSKKAQVRISQ